MENTPAMTADGAPGPSDDPVDACADAANVYISSASDVSCSDSDQDDDLSDWNEDDCNRELKNCEEKLEDITNQFDILKEMLLQEKLIEVDKKIDEIRSGTDKEYNDLLEQIDIDKKSQLKVAAVLKQFKLESLNHTFQAMDQEIRQNSKNSKEIIFDTIQSGLEKELQRLRDERNKADLDVKLSLAQHSYKNIQPKPKSVSGPCIVYMLKEDEILEDWITIKSLISPWKTGNADKQIE